MYEILEAPGGLKPQKVIQVIIKMILGQKQVGQEQHHSCLSLTKTLLLKD